jgi:Restriction endonuclease
MDAYVVRGELGPIARGLFEKLRGGSARIGWSSNENQDLTRVVQENKSGHWDQLDGGQRDAWYCHGFLDRAKEGDLLFYPNVPVYGTFCVARITGDYTHLPHDEGIDGDFRSSRACELLTPFGIEKINPVVPAIIRHKLGLRRRFYQLYVDDPTLTTFINNIPSAQATITAPDDANAIMFREFEHMMQPIHEQLSKNWPRYFPVANLSRFLSVILSRYGETVDLREGPTERGSDLIIELSNDFLDRSVVLGVQVKCYEGLIYADAVERALNQLIDGWEANTLDYGALVLSGEWTAEADKVLADHNQKCPHRRVKKVDGTQLARIVTRMSWMEN